MSGLRAHVPGLEAKSFQSLERLLGLRSRGEGPCTHPRDGAAGGCHFLRVIAQFRLGELRHDGIGIGEGAHRDHELPGGLGRILFCGALLLHLLLVGLLFFRLLFLHRRRLRHGLRRLGRRFWRKGPVVFPRYAHAHRGRASARRWVEHHWQDDDSEKHEGNSADEAPSPAPLQRIDVLLLFSHAMVSPTVRKEPNTTILSFSCAASFAATKACAAEAYW